MSNVHANLKTAAIIATFILPDHLTAEALAVEAEQYASEYKCSIEVAIRDVIDAYYEGEAEADDSLRNGDWDYGRE